MLLVAGLVALIFSYVWLWFFMELLLNQKNPHLKVDPTDFIAEGNVIRFGNWGTALYQENVHHVSAFDEQKANDFRMFDFLFLIWFHIFTYYLAELWVLMVRMYYMRLPEEDDE